MPDVESPPDATLHVATGDARTLPAPQIDPTLHAPLEDAPTLPARRPENAFPASIQRFKVLGQLGQGGMGVVYAGLDEELNRRVAIKLILSGRDLSGDAKQRMLREAQALAQISHPNIVQIFEVGAWNDSIYLAMEHLDGQTVHAWLRANRGARTVEQTLDVFIQAALGLFAVHRGGLVHRDFKPANVFISSDGRVRLLDFGLVRTHDIDDRATRPADNAVLAADLTQTGARVGTPLYMAPEALAGRATDPRSDQYSFCVALYEALYGQRPYLGKHVDELLAATERGRIEPPRPGSKVTPRLYDVLCRGLQPNPERRWRDMMELVGALRSTHQRPSLLRRAWPGLLVFALLGGSRLAQYVSRPSAQSDVPSVTGDVPDAAATLLEPMLTTIAELPRDTTRFDLFLPRQLKYREVAIDGDTARALLVDAMLDRGLLPDGYTNAKNGRTLHFSRTPTAKAR